MAQIYPESLGPDDFHGSQGERKLYGALREQLGDRWDVFHSISWLKRTGERGAWEGEIDFVVAHPDRGILCIEVKGGGVRFKDNRWERKERGRWKPYDRDPFAQAQDERYALIRLLADTPAGDHARDWVGHAVSFPEVSVPPDPLPPGAPRAVIIDRHDVERLEHSIKNALAFYRNGNAAPGARGMELLRECLVPTVELDVPLAERFGDEEEHMIRLTWEQTLLLRQRGRNKRMCIEGCAGSGKTMLAVEQAKWLHREKGLDVAFICFNRALMQHLREREKQTEVAFWTFHGLCTHLAHRAGLDVPKYQGGAPPEYFEEELPELLMQASEELGGLYDALMIDEAQDLHSHWLTALMSTLRDESEGWVWLFMDSNQKVYDARLDVPKEFVLHDLDVNCRNTQAIHREVMKKYKGEVIPRALGPEGRELGYIETGDQPGAVADEIERLCGREEVPPQDVVVLSSHGWEKSAVAHSFPGSYRFTDKRNEPGKKIFFSSIRGFNGLESKVVILCELEGIADESLDAQLYVGLSRAINHCVVVAPG